MEPPLAARMDLLGTETAFEVLARAKALEAEGKEILHFEMGEPDFDTPPHVVEAAHEALKAGYTHYGPAPGLPEFRAALAAHVSSTRGVEVGADSVVVVPGAKPILFFTILSLVEEGTEVLVPDPSFPIYESVVKGMGGTAVSYHLPEKRGFNPDPAELREKMSDRTRLVILNSPGNPTGGVMDDGEMDEFAGIVRDSDAWVLT
ncbi:MAG: pyridoxal phosphate-dependent aminotransferase, partial [Planctomycetota bacterium]